MTLRLETGKDTSPVWVPADAFIPAGGSIVAEFASRSECILYDATTAERASGSFRVDPAIATYNIELVWGNPGTDTTGNPVWRLRSYFTGDGGGIASNETLHTSVTAPALAQNAIGIVSLATGLTNATGRLHAFILDRLAGDAADDLANDAAFLGLWIVEA